VTAYFAGNRECELDIIPWGGVLGVRFARFVRDSCPAIFFGIRRDREAHCMFADPDLAIFNFQFAISGILAPCSIGS